jgi:hypothetical protein
LPGPAQGFGAVLPKHPDSWDKRHFETTYNSTHGEPKPVVKQDAQDTQTFVTTNQIFYKTGKELVSKPAGTSYKLGFLDNLKEKPGLLSGETLRLNDDPQHNTIIQRTWLPAQDAGVKARLNGIKSDVPLADNENSLPLGTGNYFAQERKDYDGAYRKIKSDVTRNPTEHVRMALR